VSGRRPLPRSKGEAHFRGWTIQTHGPGERSVGVSEIWSGEQEGARDHTGRALLRATVALDRHVAPGALLHQRRDRGTNPALVEDIYLEWLGLERADRRVLHVRWWSFGCVCFGCVPFPSSRQANGRYHAPAFDIGPPNVNHDSVDDAPHPRKPGRAARDGALVKLCDERVEGVSSR